MIAVETKDSLEISIIQCNIKIAELDMELLETEKLIALWKELKAEKEEQLKRIEL